MVIYRPPTDGYHGMIMVMVKNSASVELDTSVSVKSGTQRTSLMGSRYTLPRSSRASMGMSPMKETAARELACWEMHAGVAPEKRATTPLFCASAAPRARAHRSSAASSTTCVFSRLLLAHLKDPDEVAKYSVHNGCSPVTQSGPKVFCAMLIEQN